MNKEVKRLADDGLPFIEHVRTDYDSRGSVALVVYRVGDRQFSIRDFGSYFMLFDCELMKAHDFKGNAGQKRYISFNRAFNGLKALRVKYFSGVAA